MLRYKKHFKREISEGKLGCRQFSEILQELRPRVWGCAHLHTYFKNQIVTNSGDITTFLALDKPLPRRKYFEVYHVDKEGTFESIELLKLQEPEPK